MSNICREAQATTSGVGAKMSDKILHHDELAREYRNLQVGVELAQGDQLNILGLQQASSDACQETSLASDRAL